MRAESIILVIMAATILVMAATIYKTPTCTIEDIETALLGLEFDVVE